MTEHDTAVHWTTPASHEGGVTSRAFRVPVTAARDAQAMLFLPQAPAAVAGLPVVLVQHGGSSHKGGQDVLDLAEVFVRRHGMALVAMDGPVHGGRRDPALALDQRLAIRDRFLDLWREGHDHVAHMTQDWHAVIRGLGALPACDTGRMAWVGLSMGTAYGLPLLASGAGVCAAVVGMWGLSYPTSQRLAADAAQVVCPVLFQQKWDDALFDREGQLALYDALATPDKRLCIYPGGHTAVQGEQMRDLERFVVERLAPSA
jgi:dienelactone hydrolase